MREKAVPFESRIRNASGLERARMATCRESAQAGAAQRVRRLLVERLYQNPVGPLPRLALRRFDLESHFLDHVPADETADAVVLPVGCLRDFPEDRALLALHPVLVRELINDKEERPLRPPK